jgi:periplasmic protein TonB
VAKTSFVYGVSLFLHGALAVGVIALGTEKHVETIAISMSEAKKKEKEKPPEPAKMTEEPKQPEAKTEARQTKAKVAAPKADAPPPDAAAQARSPVLEGLPDLGLSMGNDGPGGIAIPQGGPIAAAAAPVTSAHAPPAPKVLGPKPVDECTEALVKPRRKLVSTPAYPAAAREANVEGLVRVEVSVGVDGSVTGAHILAGLGHGCDEVSLESARRASFEPATRCGKPVAATAVLPFRFKPQ